MTDYLFKHITTDDPDLKYFQEGLWRGLGLEVGLLMIAWKEIEKIE